MPDSIIKKNRFEGSTPILSVRNLSTSIDYYTNILGFKIDWNDGVMASVSRDNASVMLCQNEQGQPGTWVWFGVADVEMLYEEYKTSGAKIQQKPIDYYWAYEMRIEDPDGHVLRFGSDPKKDESYK
jgi:predicted lactoylglutathione lyase